MILCALAALVLLLALDTDPRRVLFNTAVRQFDIMVASSIGSVELNLERSMRDTAAYSYTVSDHDMQKVKDAMEFEHEKTRRWMTTEWLDQAMASFFASDHRVALLCNSTFNILEMRRLCSACVNQSTAVLMPNTVLIINRAIVACHSRHVARVESKLSHLKQELLHKDVLDELEEAQRNVSKPIAIIFSSFLITLCVTTVVYMTSMMLLA